VTVSPEWRRLAPGVYDDGHGGMHLDVRELLEANGYEATQANIDRLSAAAEAIAREEGLEIVEEP
jgi:hypothetical protein